MSPGTGVGRPTRSHRRWQASLPGECQRKGTDLTLPDLGPQNDQEGLFPLYNPDTEHGARSKWPRNTVQYLRKLSKGPGTLALLITIQYDPGN